MTCTWCKEPAVLGRKKCETHLRAARRAYDKKLEHRQALIRKAKDVPCADCGVQYPYYVMQFDHRNPELKEFNISRTLYAEQRVLTEIAKCDVVCANCHAERTFGGNPEYERLPR